MKEELHGYLEKYIEFWKKERGTLPMIPFDEDCQTKMYVGETDEDEYIQWNYKKNDNVIEFVDIEKKYNVKIHSDLNEYYNSYYFLQLEGFIDGKLIWLDSIDEEKDILGELEYIFENEEKHMIQIGVEGGSDLPIYFEMSSGNIVVYDFENNDNKVLVSSLKELFNKLETKKN